MLKKSIRFLSVLTIFGVFLALMTMQGAPSGVASAQSEELRVPLGTDCRGVAPLTDEACCIFGHIYLNDEVIEEATVSIESDSGTLTPPITTMKGSQSQPDEPYYSGSLTASPLSASVGDVVTITVSYKDMVSTRTWTVQPGSQQVDMGLIEGYQASEPFSADSALDQPAANAQAEGGTAVLAGASSDGEEAQALTNVANLSSPEPAVAPPNPVASEADVASALQNAPVMFVENVGQFDDDARFHVRGGDYDLWLADDALWVTRLEAADPFGEELREPFDQQAHLRENNELDEARKGVNLKLSFVGANAQPEMEPFDLLETKMNYFLGNDEDKWRSNVPVWGGVRYKNIYPGIDLELTSENGRSVQRFVVHSRANPSSLATSLDVVQLRVEGADGMQLLTNTDLIAKTAIGDVALPLFAIVTPDGTPLDITRGPTLNNNRIQTPFAPANQETLSRVPNSTLGFSTFIGGASNDYGSSLALDSAGNVVVMGWASSSDFPTTAGSYDTTHNGSLDTFVFKLSAAGDALLYNTFIGGSSSENGLSLALDSADNIVVTGRTLSSDFPTTAGSYDTTYNGNYDTFAFKLSTAGDALAYSTFIGGSSYDDSSSLALDSTGNLVVTGRTSSSDFPTTAGSYDTTYNGNYDTFVFKLSVAGDALAYSTFIGGSSYDVGRSLALDNAGNAFVMGWTESPDFPTTADSYDTTYNDGQDTFVFKLSTAGDALAYSTFIGGSSSDTGLSLALDSTGNTIVTGWTESSNFPTTVGSYDTTYNGGSDAFVFKLSVAGDVLAYSTFIGGSSSENGYSLALDSGGNAIVTGYTSSSNFPMTAGSYDTTYNDGQDTFVFKLSTAGDILAYSTFIGGSSSDYGYSLALDSAGNLVVTGSTSSSDFPTTVGSYDTTHNGNSDVFVLRLDGLGPLGPDIAVSPASISATVKDGQSSNDTLVIRNTGTSDLTWQVSSSAAWLSVASTSGTVASEGAASVTVGVDASGLSAGTYADTLTITSNDPDEASIEVPVSLVVGSLNITETKLTASDGAEGDYFGGSVSIDGDVALVGAYWDDDNGTDSGSAYIYRLSGSQWVQEAKLLASDGGFRDFFGLKVSIDGDVAIVGASGDNSLSGSAYVYRRNGSQWVQEAKLLASDGAAGDRFGLSVSIDGDVALVAAYEDDDNGSASGSAYIYRRNGNQWVEEAKLLASDGAQSDHFGQSVSISGNVALVGARRDNDNGHNSGSAYIYRWNGSQWVQESKLLASDGTSVDYFGQSVSIDGNVALVGTSGDGNAAYVYRWDGNQWQEESKLLANDGVQGDDFGWSVNISGNVAIVAARYDDDNGTDSGSAYIYHWNGSQWQQKSKLLASDGALGDQFGRWVSTDGNRALVGAVGDDDNGSSSGAAYVYDLFSDSAPGDPSDPPVAAFSASIMTGNAPLNVQFTDESSGDIVSWTWKFGDEDETVSGGRHPEHMYTSEGTYTVSLTVSGPGGEDSKTEEAYITVGPPREVNTLILTNREKVVELYNEDAARDLMDKLQDLAAHERVKGDIIQVENELGVAMASAYDEWDADPTSTEKANAVTSAIKNVIDRKLASYQDVQYIVVAGDDRVIPFRRVLDQTWYPEKRYQDDVSCDGVTGAALCDNMTLTDDYYANYAPFTPRSRTWDGRPFYLPDFAIGRLIETPQEMIDQIQTFLDDDNIAISNGVVTGYSFVTDAADKSCDALKGAGLATDCDLVGDDWSKGDFISKVLNGSRDLASINGHADHYQIGAPDESVVTSHDIANASNIDQRALFYTIACHSGLNVPPSNPNPLDTAQAFAQKKANYVANTGYGWGLRRSVGLSEKLMLDFSKELARNETLGQALMRAKQWYYLRDYQFSDYDEKILIESTLYGLPMYKVTLPSSQRVPLSDELPESVEVEEREIPLDEGLSKTQIDFDLPALTKVITDTGTFYTLDGLVHSEHGEPMQPKLPFDVSEPDTNAHGLVFRGGTYRDISDFDPVIAQAFTVTYPTALLAEPEPPFTEINWYPAIPSQLNILDDGAQAQMTALVGQYNNSIAGGTERLYSELNVEVYYHTDSDDWTAPTITSVSSQLATDTATVTVATSDNSGIHEVLITHTDNQNNQHGTWQSTALTNNGSAWTGSFPASANTRFFVQVVDKAGNVAVDDNNRRYYPPAFTSDSNVTPRYGLNDGPSTVYIYGSGFSDSSTVKLGGELLEVDFVVTDEDPQRIRAVVPAGVALGVYDLYVETGSDSVTFPNAYEVLDAGITDDLLSEPEWLWTNPMPMRVGYSDSSVGLLVQHLGGTTTVDAVTVEFRLGGPDGEVLGRSLTNLLAPDATESTGPVTWQPTEPSDPDGDPMNYTVCAIIDPDNAVPESNENNNIVCRGHGRGVNSPITVLPPHDFGPEELCPDPNNPVCNPDTEPPEVDRFMIDNNALATNQQAVRLDVDATDYPNPDGSGMNAVRRLEFEYIHGARRWVPVKISDWVDYETSRSSYDWELVPSYGMRYMQAWASDNNQNISLKPGVDVIDLLPTEQADTVGRNGVVIYRILLEEGERFAATMTPGSGDPNMYVWLQDGSLRHDVNPEAPGAETVEFDAPLKGTYQIEIHGPSSGSADYRLTFGASRGAQMDDPLAHSRRAPEGVPVPDKPAVPLDEWPEYYDVGIPPPPEYTIYLPITIRESSHR